MQNLPEEECARSMEFFRNRITCEWCHHPREVVMPRTHLCKHCNRIRLELRRLETRNEAFEHERGGLTYMMRWDVEVQREMVEDAQFEGRLYGHFYDDDLIPLGL